MKRSAAVTLVVGGALGVTVTGAFAAAPPQARGSVTRTTSGRPAPGLKEVKSPSACPVGDSSVARATGSTQAKGYELVPGGATSVLLCRYNGMRNPPPINDPLAKPFGLVAHHDVTAATTTAKLVAAMNRVKVTSGVYSCPSDSEADIVAYFRYPGDKAYEYRIDTGGCSTITSGAVWRYGLDAPFISRMEKLTPPKKYGTVKGRLVICTALSNNCGPVTQIAEAPSICTPAHCGQYRVSLVTKSGKTVTTVTVNYRDRFTAYAPPGRYKVIPRETPAKGIQPMGTSRRMREAGSSGSIVGSVTTTWVTVKTGRTTHVVVYVRSGPIQPQRQTAQS